MKRFLWLIALLLIAIPASAQFVPSPNTVGSPPNGERLNLVGDNIAIYCVPGGVSVWNTNTITPGQDELVFEVTIEQIQAAINAAVSTGQNQLIATGIRGVSLHALTSGDLQAVIQEPLRSYYSFTFPAGRCGYVNIPAPGSSIFTQPTVVAPTPVYTPVVPIYTTGTVYTVRAGDTVFRIGLRFGTTVAAIAAVNNLPNPNLIFVGQVLVIPASTYNPVVSSCTSPYQVQPGDTLALIAQRCNITLTTLASANNMTGMNVVAGTFLLIP